MEGALPPQDVKIVQDGAGRGHRLGPHAAAAGRQVAGGDFRNQLLQIVNEHRLAVGTMHFLHPGAPVPGGHFPEAWEGEGSHSFADADVAFAVALPRPGQHRVGAGFHIAVDVAGVMHPQKGEARVGNRIDQPFDQVMAAGRQLVVLAAEGNDADVGVLPRHPRQAVGVEAGAVDDVPGLQGAAFRFQSGGAGRRPGADYGGAGKNVAAGRLELAGVGVGHAHIVHNAGMRRPQGAHAGGVGFNLRQPFRADNLQVGNAVGYAPLVEVLQPSQLAFVGGDNHLAAGVVFNFVAVAEVNETVFAGHAEPGFPGAGTVVDAGVNDAAVVPGLVLRQARLFLNDGHAQIGAAFQQLHGRGQPDDAAAHDAHIVDTGFQGRGAVGVGLGRHRPYSSVPGRPGAPGCAAGSVAVAMPARVRFLPPVARLPVARLYVVGPPLPGRRLSGRSRWGSMVHTRRAIGNKPAPFARAGA